LDKYLGMIEAEGTTLRTYRGYIDKHVRPFVGRLQVGAVDADTLDSLYAELRRCRDHCTGRRLRIDHRTADTHQCDGRCRAHECRPLASSTIRQIHFILSGAYKRALRWRWVTTSPVVQAEPPSARPPDPQPPSAEEAARILGDAWRDPDWGALVWFAMTTGARRGEVCGLRWAHVDLDTGVVTLRRSIAQHGGSTEEKDTKTHQQRRVALDPATIAVLTEHWERCTARAAALGMPLTRGAFVFSLGPDCSTHLKPDTVSQRYRRMAERLRLDTHLHSLRHYSATELIPAERAKTDPHSPFERVAAALRLEILEGSQPDGSALPTVKELCNRFTVSAGTANRAVALLRTWGLIDVSRGHRAVVLPRPVSDAESAGVSQCTMTAADGGILPGSDPRSGVDGQAATRPGGPTQLHRSERGDG
ncbi:MAG: tyrosine-type recombinase/integrase, partial [Acidobacteria bacterium]|nr:tyrosine-type recombinase/integrase [Acidobacteriota bacterium]